MFRSGQTSSNSPLSVTIHFFPPPFVLADINFDMLKEFCALGTIQLEDCCAISGFGQRNTGVAAL